MGGGRDCLCCLPKGGCGKDRKVREDVGLLGGFGELCVVVLYVKVCVASTGLLLIIISVRERDAASQSLRADVVLILPFFSNFVSMHDSGCRSFSCNKCRSSLFDATDFPRNLFSG